MRDSNASPQVLDELTVSNEEFYNGKLAARTLENFRTLHLNNASISNEESTKENLLGRQKVSDKTVADCVEAILGASLKSFGVLRNFKLLQMFNILPMTPDRDISDMLNIKLKSPRIRTNISDREVDRFLAKHEELERIINYKFNDRAYLLQALTHPSYSTNRVTGCYQQLEFLGDAVLDFLVSTYIFERHIYMDPGELTDLRSALVNNVTLACICVRNRIHNYILSENSKLTESILTFAEFQEAHGHEVTEHVQLLTEESETEGTMAEYTGVPKALGDIIEAIIGGVFLDCGNDLRETWRVIYLLLQTELDKFSKNVPKEIVRQLFEMEGVRPEFESPVEVDDKMMVTLNFTLKGEKKQVHGFGSNKNDARKAAAKNALHLLNPTDHKTAAF